MEGVVAVIVRKIATAPGASSSWEILRHHEQWTAAKLPRAPVPTKRPACAACGKVPGGRGRQMYAGVCNMCRLVLSPQAIGQASRRAARLAR